jgi:hypothetical protein
MSKYRILEKLGTTVVLDHKCTYETCGEFPGCDTYLPLYIVQEDKANKEEVLWADWKDVKEFTNLDEAKSYKRNLELIEGIVIE